MFSVLKKRIKKLLYQSGDYISGYNKKEFEHIGDHCIIGPECILVPQNMYIEDYVIIQGRNNFISYKGKLVIKKYSVISSSCIIVPSNHILSVGVPFYLNAISHVGDEDHTIVINEDVWIGAGCKLLPKSSFGRGCIVGTGSVVTKDIPPYAVVAGCPAKIIAVKFSKTDIISHEKKIYPRNERLSSKELDALFEKFYKGIKPLNTYSYTDMESNRLQCIINDLNINISL